MKKTLTLIALVAIAMLAVAPSFAVAPADAGGTMWAKEGTVNDGYAPVNPKANGYGGWGNEYALQNFVVQYGSGSYSGIYSWQNLQGWLDGGSDEAIDVEADVEMYYQSATQNHKIYFHIANPFTFPAESKVAIVTSQQTTNHHMYVGITFPTPKADIVWEGFPSALTGKLIGGMKGTVDLGGRPMDGAPQPKDAMDIKFTMQVNGTGGYLPPNSAGSQGAHGTISDSTMWWWPDTLGGPIPEGTCTLDYKVEIFPRADQNDGNYELDPMISVSPEL